ncbi:hypothetical protein SAMN04488034_105158 [Salinimicrobium catena]|uniref:Uncharacterized protein n=1 Tax=Salinimicrobium catena TaxID=390640 RepID=A0A1H5NVA7_9FLAO|nr:hypothetical protein [Salinimicrobium catena]SDL52003.1 hypothetical protein SAMN04488140_1053 [Salinimicrobium catena]SEF04658.1 hypothetical protein SAMN04488034_105158 [Salinimicrobium catena]
MKYKLTSAFLIIGFATFGQEFGFDIHKTSLDQYIQMEEDLGSESLPVTSNHVSFSGNAQPFKFRRQQKGLPDLISYYYFKEKDSAMSHVLYEWDESRQAENTDLDRKKSREYQKALIRKFNQLEERISDRYGEPETTGDLTDLEQADKKSGLEKKDLWRPNDSTEIELYTVISNYYEKRGMITIKPTHRIRLEVKKTEKGDNNSSTISEERLQTLTALTGEFFRALSAEDLSGSKQFLSARIKEAVTREQLTALIANIDFDRETELIYSGIQVGTDGRSYTMLQYKYKDDVGDIPKL